jgi:cellulose synthase/poly-beta-1,6-N-acetylglucosamine synthase-like glycosyltransferase
MMNYFTHNHESSQWLVHGVGETMPTHEETYFRVASSKYGSKCIELGSKRLATKRRKRTTVISVCIPCFNEDANALERTLESLRAQILPEQHVMEVLVVMDGIEKMSESMRAYIQYIYGLSICMPDGKTQDPFKRLPSAETIIVEPYNDQIADKDRCGFGSISLVLKKNNQRKVNSHMWWLGGHAKDLGCEFALATDCGIIFEPTAVWHMLGRLEQDQGLVAVTGFQRVMTATMQGDGSFELLTDPIGYVLRQIQRFDFEVSFRRAILQSAGMGQYQFLCSNYFFPTHSWINLSPSQPLTRLVLCQFCQVPVVCIGTRNLAPSKRA